jgi:hypothetical protein
MINNDVADNFCKMIYQNQIQNNVFYCIKNSVSCECNKFDIEKKFEDAKRVIKSLLQYNGQSIRKRSKGQTVIHKALKIEQQKNN